MAFIVMIITGWKPTMGSHIQKTKLVKVPVHVCRRAVERL